VVVAGGAPLTADAAVAAPLARHLHAPLLLVAQDAVPASVQAWLQKRHVTKVIVVGGADSVSDAVLASLGQLVATGGTVTRLAGADRYDTSALVARQIGAPAGFAVVGAGDDAQLASVVAAAAAAAAADRPLLLVPSAGAVPTSVSQVLSELKVRGTTCVGAADALSDSTRAALPSCARVAGADAPATAAAVVKAFDRTVHPSALAVATSPLDRLTDAVTAAGRGMLLLYADTTVPAATLTALRAEPAVGSLTVLGGVSGVSAAAVAALRFA
jgi:putative cell wall-binding protein